MKLEGGIPASGKYWKDWLECGELHLNIKMGINWYVFNV